MGASPYPASVLPEMGARIRQRLPVADLRWEWGYRHPEDVRNVVAEAFPHTPHPYLYRGQNHRFSPCFPSIMRGVDLAGRGLREWPLSAIAALIERRCKIMRFCRDLGRHPAFEFAEKHRNRIQPVALAQHYGVATFNLDLTSDFDVAAFFATCLYDPVSRRWGPAEEGSTGVLYRLDALHPDLPINRFSPIGMQPFDRPNVQSGWVVELMVHEDFEALPHLEALTFVQEKSVSEYYLDTFDGGVGVYPKDMIARLAKETNASPSLFVEDLEFNLKDLAGVENGLDEAQVAALRTAFLEQNRVSETAFSSVTPALMDAWAAEWTSVGERFFNEIGFRMVRLQSGEVRIPTWIEIAMARRQDEDVNAQRDTQYFQTL